MIVVAIIGILAAIAVFGVMKYLNAANAAEAKQSIGEISRAAHGAFEREMMESENVLEGNNSLQASHNLCGSATAVPAALQVGRKYQPQTAAGADFQSGDEGNGWFCLKFSISQPIRYQYHYTVGSSPAAPNSPSSCSVADCYEAGAVGDVDADGIFSRFARTGVVNTNTGELRASTYVYIENEIE
ncbi:MAG: fimbiral protein pilA [Myxococcales bacterium]|nr:fimbiral protein pilA [Myxococcales bacterium]